VGNFGYAWADQPEEPPMPDPLDVLRPGFVYPEWETRVGPERQARKHQCLDIEAALYGDIADIAFFGMDSILATRHAGLPVNGSVHMRQVFRLKDPIRIGEPLAVRGRVTRVEPAKRGHVVWSSFEFVRPDGSVPLVSDRAGLRVDPAAAERANQAGRDAATPEPDPRAGMTLLFEKQLTPEKVASFSDEAGNLIHSDPEVARQFGFRAPIAAGLMGAHFVLEAVARQGGPPAELDMEMQFLRPMFWDERLAIHGRFGPGGSLAEIAIVNGAAKATGRATIAHVRLER
jgi:MaoC like domain